MPIAGVSHISLTVSDLTASRAWYAYVLGWSELMSSRSDTTTFSYGLLPGNVAIVLRQHDEPEISAFDPRRPGLDHLSFQVSDLADLSAIEQRVRERGGDFTATVDSALGRLLTVRDPDGTALEFIGSAG